MSTTSPYCRHDGRAVDQLREFTFEFDIAPNAAGSVLARCGKTQVICAASIDNNVPKWMGPDADSGWVTAEYSMLPYSTAPRKPRDIAKGKLDGRSTEIQRLIGRSLRAVVDLKALGPRSIWVDCDVLAADGGTRTTAITGAYLALRQACDGLIADGVLDESPLKAQLAATSVGVVEGTPLLDLCYVEDRDAAVDMNVVMTSQGEFVELQATGEEATFTADELDSLTSLARKGIDDLFLLQREALEKRSVAT